MKKRLFTTVAILSALVTLAACTPKVENEPEKGAILSCVKSTVYEENGEVLETIEEDYDDSGRKMSELRYGNNGNKRYTNYDEMENETMFTETDKDGATKSKYEYVRKYDENGNIISLKEIGANENLISETEYEYDPHGNLISEKVKRGDIEKYVVRHKYTYDFHYRIKKDVIINEWDVHEFTSQFTYDKKGRILSEKCTDEVNPEEHSRSYVIEYAYDKNGNPTTITQYDAKGETDDKTVYEYYENGILAKESWSNGCDWHEYEYDEKGNTTKSSTYWALGAFDPSVIEYEYEYDKDGNVKSRTGYKEDSLFVVDEYTYWNN